MTVEKLNPARWRGSVVGAMEFDAVWLFGGVRVQQAEMAARPTQLPHIPSMLFLEPADLCALPIEPARYFETAVEYLAAPEPDVAVLFDGLPDGDQEPAQNVRLGVLHPCPVLGAGGQILDHISADLH